MAVRARPLPGSPPVPLVRWQRRSSSRFADLSHFDSGPRQRQARAALTDPPSPPCTRAPPKEKSQAATTTSRNHAPTTTHLRILPGHLRTSRSASSRINQTRRRTGFITHEARRSQQRSAHPIALSLRPETLPTPARSSPLRTSYLIPSDKSPVWPKKKTSAPSPWRIAGYIRYGCPWSPRPTARAEPVSRRGKYESRHTKRRRNCSRRHPTSTTQHFARLSKTRVCGSRQRRIRTLPPNKTASPRSAHFSSSAAGMAPCEPGRTR